MFVRFATSTLILALNYYCLFCYIHVNCDIDTSNRLSIQDLKSAQPSQLDEQQFNKLMSVLTKRAAEIGKQAKKIPKLAQRPKTTTTSTTTTTEPTTQSQPEESINGAENSESSEDSDVASSSDDDNSDYDDPTSGEDSSAKNSESETQTETENRNESRLEVDEPTKTEAKPKPTKSMAEFSKETKKQIYNNDIKKNNKQNEPETRPTKSAPKKKSNNTNKDDKVIDNSSDISKQAAKLDNNNNNNQNQAIAKNRTHKAAFVKLPFIKPKNMSACTPEAYLEFPHDIIGNKWRARGFVVIHIGIVCYMFYSLALVCEKYFMPALEEFAQRLQLSEDVAGATLMSAGSSAPELFTALLGVFISKGDVGTGTIVGSAVFNILFVIGVCAFVSTTVAQLNWWPVLRDSVFYTLTVLVLIMFINDEEVTAFESGFMIILYGVYITIMKYNDYLRDLVTKILLSNPNTAKLISSGISVEGSDDVFAITSQATNPQYQTTSFNTVSEGRSVEEDSIFMAACLVIIQHKRLFRSTLRFQFAARYIMTKRQHKLRDSSKPKTTGQSDEVNYFGPESEQMSQKHSNQKTRIEAYVKGSGVSKNKFSIVSRDDYEFWNRPPEEGEIPDCALYPDRYLLAFFMSVLWTAIFSYVNVWMVTLIGYTLGIPDSVMGVTFLAAGTSIPDCYSSIHAAKNGMADMAVSNSIGSNVFDILIGLAVPWFIQSAIYPGIVATINSRGIVYSVVLLFLSLIVTIYLMNKHEWTLKPRLGLALLIAYALFIILTCMLEFNLFGYVNPPPCPVKS